MNDLMREVDEAMRQERMEKFWQENRQSLIFFVIATIVLTGLISAYRTWDAGMKAANTDRLLTIMEDKNFHDNIKDAKIDLRPGLRGIALINGGQKYLSEKKDAEALALYTKAAEDGSIPSEIRDMAILMEARLTKEPDEKLMKHLKDVATNHGSPWQNHARIEYAAISASKGDYKTARGYLADVMEDKEIPETLYKKAEALDHLYTLKQPESGAPQKAGS